jgi:hypothetical protein
VKVEVKIYKFFHGHDGELDKEGQWVKKSDHDLVILDRGIKEELSHSENRDTISQLCIKYSSLKTSLDEAVKSIDCAVRYLESTGIDKPENDWDPEFQMLQDLRKTLQKIRGNK